MTTSQLREVVARCADRLEASAQLALLESRGPEPLAGAEYLTDTLEDLEADLAQLRAVARPGGRSLVRGADGKLRADARESKRTGLSPLLLPRTRSR